MEEKQFKEQLESCCSSSLADIDLLLRSCGKVAGPISYHMYVYAEVQDECIHICRYVHVIVFSWLHYCSLESSDPLQCHPNYIIDK